MHCTETRVKSQGERSIGFNASLFRFSSVTFLTLSHSHTHSLSSRESPKPSNGREQSIKQSSNRASKQSSNQGIRGFLFASRTMTTNGFRDIAGTVPYGLASPSDFFRRNNARLTPLPSHRHSRFLEYSFPGVCQTRITPLPYRFLPVGRHSLYLYIPVHPLVRCIETSVPIPVL